MPAEGVQLSPAQELLTNSEVVRLSRLFVSQGVDKIRLTGGEPLVRRDLEELVGSITELPGLRSLGITTNGVTLRHRVAGLHQAGLNTINVSLDTMVPEKFEFITRRAKQGYPPANLIGCVTCGCIQVTLECWRALRRHYLLVSRQ